MKTSKDRRSSASLREETFVSGGGHEQPSIDKFLKPPHALPVAKLGEFLRGGGIPPAASTKPLDKWRMEDDDAPIFRYLYQTHRPRRHLEFGTWQGWGATLCLESCDATVWTINLLDGETLKDGSWGYSERVLHPDSAPQDVTSVNFGEDELGPRTYHRTDARGYIGRIYRERQMGHRVCQIYCDSREWDISNYPPDFFDSVLIDGGHEPDIVISDARKALCVLRSGGLIMCHDFCPHPEIRSQFESVNGVTAGIGSILPELRGQLRRLCWINPSWILVGLKK
jgi:predicted O-methyltransferase YrrM